MADLSGQFAPENYNRVLAALLMKQGLDTSPIQSWTQGAARLAQALVGARYRDLDQRDTLAAMQYNPMSPMGNKVADALSSPQPTSTPQPEQGGLIPAAIRYNNPGAQWPGPVATQFGSTDSGVIGGGNKIAQFPDQESGAAAQFALLQKNYAGMPLSAAIQKWSGGNSSPEYTTAISKATGLAPDTVLTPEILQNPSIAIPVAKAMAQVEAGRPYPMTDQQWQQAHSRANPQMAQASPIDAMEANVNRTLADPNVPLAIKQKAYGYKQWIIQHRLEQNMKYGPEALAGEGALAGAKESGKLGAQYSPQNITGSALKTGMEEAAKLPAQKELKGAPSFEDTQKLEQKTNAQKVLSGTVSNVTDAYLALDKLGGVINPDRTATENIQSRARSSAAGQATGMAVGTQEASIRQQIANSQPQLINAIRQATNMGARGLDSNVELAFYMKQVGDPTRDIYSNLAALDRLDKAYGLGLGVKSKVSPAMYNKIQSAQNQLGDQFNAIIKEGQGGDMLSQAKDAIARGAPRDAVIQRLRQNGIDPGDL